jgi:hypothetical protein
MEIVVARSSSLDLSLRRSIADNYREIGSQVNIGNWPMDG